MGAAKSVSPFSTMCACGSSKILWIAFASAAFSTFVIAEKVKHLKFLMGGVFCRQSTKRSTDILATKSPLRKTYKAISGLQKMWELAVRGLVRGGTHTLFDPYAKL